MDGERMARMLEYTLDLLPGSYNYSPTIDSCALSFPFCCTDSGKFINGDAYYTKRDRFDRYLLIATDGGCGKMYWKGQSCLLEKGSSVLIDCNSYQEYATLPGRTWSFFYLHFNALSMEGYKNTLLSRLTLVKLRSPEYVWQMIEEIHRLTHRTDVLSYAVQSNAVSNLLTELLCSLAENSAASSPLYRPDIEALAEYIRDHCNEPLSLKDFTEIAHLSRHHLIRVFAGQIGMSPYKYLHLCRVNRGQHLLKTTDMTVSQIAYAVGYNDPILFTRHFKAFHDVTPTDYRREYILLPAGGNLPSPPRP